MNMLKKCGLSFLCIYKHRYAVLWTVVILILTLVPAPGLDKLPLIPIPHFDKLVHFGLFGILSAIILVETQNYKAKTPFFIMLVWTTLLAAATEMLQHWMHAGRTADLVDFIAGMAGSFASTGWYYGFFPGVQPDN